MEGDARVDPSGPSIGSRRDRSGGPFVRQLEILGRLLRYPSAAAAALDTRVGTTPCDVCFERGTHRLLRYRRQTTATWSEPVLFCYALINRPYILDLKPDKSVVRQYLDRGFDVYIIDWGVPGPGDRCLTLRHYVCEFLKEAVEYILREGGCPSVHLLGYCMGGTLSALFTALHPDLVKTLTLLATPIDFSGREALLHLWTNPQYFDVDALIDAHGNCPAWFLQACFQSMKPVENMLEKHVTLYSHLDEPEFLANFFAMELWINDNIPVAGETFREFVKKLYQSNQLVRGELTVGDREVDLRRIACPLLLLTATNDHLVPSPSTEGIRPHVASRDVESMTIDAGHVGLVVGGKAQRELWPKAVGWLAGRSTAARGWPSTSAEPGRT